MIIDGRVGKNSVAGGSVGGFGTEVAGVAGGGCMHIQGSKLVNKMMPANLRTFDRVAPKPSTCSVYPLILSSPFPLRRLLSLAGLLTIFTGSAAQAQSASASPNDDPSYRKEFVYGVNFNTRGGLIGGVSVRSTRVLNENWSRFWSIEAVEVKHRKERRVASFNGSSFVLDKANYFIVLRPSVGAQRVVFRKAAESGVQVNALMSAGPSIGLLMPYYINYDHTIRDINGRPISGEDVRTEQYDPYIHTDQSLIRDRAPLFTGANETKPYVGVHWRGALSFEYGRYRDAVAGVETGVLLELYGKKPVILRSRDVPDSKINNSFYPSVYLTIYLGSRS